MTKKSKIKKLLGVLSPDDSLTAGFKAFDEGTKALKRELEKNVKVATLDDVNKEIENFRKRIDLKPIIEAVDLIRSDVEERVIELANAVEEMMGEERLESDKRNNESKSEYDGKITSLGSKIDSYRQETLSLIKGKTAEIAEITRELKALQGEEERALKSIKKVEVSVENLVSQDESLEVLINQESSERLKDIDSLKKEIYGRIGNLNRGGAMNRQELFNGVDYLTKYTDINWKAGNNVTFTVSENNSTKRVDVTISSSGSGGGGITRVITNVSIDTSAGDSTDTDYVYLVSGTTAITLPTAVGNENLYTIKNVGSGTVTVNTTGGETIDDGLTVSLPVQYTSVDIISDGTNWKVT